jgi:hypothetical protein
VSGHLYTTTGSSVEEESPGSNWGSGVPRNFWGGGGYARNFFGGGGYARNFFGGGSSTNSVEDRGQRERGSGGGSPLVRGSTQFANE